MRKQERIWKQYPNAHTWQSLKDVRKSYCRAIHMEKRRIISGNVVRAQKNPKELYHLTQALTGCQVENPLPKGFSDMDLAQGFSDFFYEKVKKIHQVLLRFPQFSSSKADIPPLTTF